MNRGWQNFFTGLENYGKGLADVALSTVGAGNVINEDDYKGNSKKGFTKATNAIGSAVGALAPMALNMVAPGAGTALSAVQKGVGAATNSQTQQMDPNLLTNAGDMINQAKNMTGMMDTLGSLNIMPYGGTMQGMPQLEKQEVFQTPQGYVGQVDAGTHAEGGVNMPNMPNNTRVYSDRLKTRRGKTYAEEAAVYKTDKWQKMLDNPNTDSFGKSTAQRMIDMSNKKLDKLFVEQEGYKALKGLSNDGKKMKFGGDINKYPDGGITGNITPTPTGQVYGANAAYKASNLYDIKTGEQLFYGPGNVTVPLSQIPLQQMGARYSGITGTDPVTGAKISKMPNGGTVSFEPYQDANGKWIQNMNVKGGYWYANEADKAANKPATKPAIMQVNGQWVPYQPTPTSNSMRSYDTKPPVNGLDSQQYPNGGTISKYSHGGTHKPDPRLQYFSDAKLNPPGQIPQNYIPSYGTESFEEFNPNYDPTIQPSNTWNINQQVPTLKTTNPPIGGFESPNFQSRNPYGMQNAKVPAQLDPNSINTLSQQDPRATPVKDFLQQTNPYFSAATIGNFLGPAYDIYRGLKGPDEVNFERVNPELVDYSQSRKMGVQETNRGFNMTSKAIQEGTGGNAGTYLSNVNQAGAMRDEGNRKMISQSYENEKNMNANIRNQAKSQNAGIQMQESIARQQEKDIAKNTTATGLYNLGAALNTYGTDMQLKGNEKILQELIKTGDYEFIYRNNKPVALKSKIGKGKITPFSGNNTKDEEYLQKLIDEAGEI